MNMILVTGALGQIGTELVLALQEKYGKDKIIASDLKEPNNYSGKLIESVNSETPFTISVHRINGIWRGLIPELIISDAIIDFKKGFLSPVKVDQVRLSFNPIASFFAQSPR